MIKKFLLDLLSIKEEEFVLIRLKNHLYEQKKFNNVVKDEPKPEYKKYQTPGWVVFVCIIAALASPFYGVFFLETFGNPTSLFASSFFTLVLIFAAVFIPKILIEDRRKDIYNAQMIEYNSNLEKQQFKRTVINQRIGSAIDAIDSELKLLHEFEGKMCIRDFTSLKHRTYENVAISIDLVEDEDMRFNELTKKINHEEIVNPKIFEMDKIYQNLEKIDSKRYPVFYQSIIKTLEQIEYLKAELDKLIIIYPSGKIEGTGFKKFLKKQKEKNRKLLREYIKN